MKPALQSVLNDPRIWRANTGNHHQQTLSTGFKKLDAILPGDGWPLSAVSEILLPETGTSELRLLLPVLVQQTIDDGWAAMVTPPLPPYASGLAGHGMNLSRLLLIETNNKADTLWAAEQILRSGQCRLVLCWPEKPTARHKHRLQLAAETGNSCAIMILPACMNQPSGSALKLQLKTTEAGLHVRSLKCRGGRPGRECTLGHV